MPFEEALAFWYGRINYEVRSAQPGDLKLERMRALLRLLGDPHRRLRIVHVAGTKGKGSTSAMLAAVLRAAGYRTGLFTSPHLSDVRERIQIDGEPISREELAARMAEIVPAVRELESAGEPAASPTFFEVGTALGFLHFVCRRAEFAILEVGLGGRFDSTNVCDPLVSVITSISIDHTAQLGNTVARIAFEKAGIIKPRRPVVTTAGDPEALAVIERVAAERRAPLAALGREFRYEYEAGRWGGEEPNSPGPPSLRGKGGVQSLIAPGTNKVSPEPPNPQSPPFLPREGGPGGLGSSLRVTTPHRTWPWLQIGLFGEHQAANAAGVIATVEALRRLGVPIPDAAIARGLAEVRWPGRLEVVGTRPLVLLDCAHNVASARALVESLRQSFPVPGRKLLVFAVSNDKQVPEMLRVLAPHFDHFHLTRYGNNPRCVPPEQLAELLRGISPATASSMHPTAAEAWAAARETAGADDLVCITGSVFLVGELRPMILREGF